MSTSFGDWNELAATLPGVTKINVDVALSPNVNFYRSSMVARDAGGQCLWWQTKTVAGTLSSTNGAAYVVYNGLTLAIAKGCMNIDVEGDCLEVINILSHGVRSLAPSGALLETCLFFLPLFSSLNFSFVNRSGNALAHELATNPCYSSL